MRRKISTLLAIILIVATILSGCSSPNNAPAPATPAAPAAPTAPAAPAKPSTFKIGLEAGYPPFNWTQMDNSNGAVPIDGTKEFAGGYDVEIAKKIAAGLGKELVVVKIEWDGLLPALTSGMIDGIIAGMSPTSERAQQIDFSNVYYTSKFVMVVKKGGAYENAKSIQDFKGAKITAQLNTSNYKAIDQINGVNKQTAMDNFPAMRVAVESGIIDGYVAEKPEAISASTANPKLVYVEFKEGFNVPLEDTSVAVGLKKGSEYTKKINEILAGITEADREKMIENAIKNQPAAK